MKIFLVVLSFLILASCATHNPYQKYYKEYVRSNQTDKFRPIIRVESDPKATPKLMLTSDLKVAIQQTFANGFECIGYSAFLGGTYDDYLAVDFGKTIGAELVIMARIPQGTAYQQIPTIIPIISTTNSKFGSTSNITTVGTSTTVAVDQYNHQTYYCYKPDRTAVFGVRVKDLTVEERKIFGSNRGMKVLVVVKGTPAYKADVLIDDILLNMGGDEINSLEDYTKALSKHSGKEIAFTLNRSGNIIEGRALLNISDSTPYVL